MGITITGNHHWREIYYKVPEWNEDDEDPHMEACFDYRGDTYFLSDFMTVDKYSPFYDDGYHGHHSEGFFYGIVIKISDCGDGVQVFSYYS